MELSNVVAHHSGSLVVNRRICLPFNSFTYGLKGRGLLPAGVPDIRLVGNR